MAERLGELERAVEALVFASEVPIGLEEIERRLGTETGIVEALEALAARHAGCGINLVRCGEC
jgi:segregation and condensation protein B